QVRHPVCCSGAVGTRSRTARARWLDPPVRRRSVGRARAAVGGRRQRLEVEVLAVHPDIATDDDVLVPCEVVENRLTYLAQPLDAHQLGSEAIDVESLQR